MINKKKIPVTVVIPTLGYDHIKFCLRAINLNTHLPTEVLVVVPQSNYKKMKDLKPLYKILNLNIILSKKKNQVYQRILGFKNCKTDYVMQLDDDVELKKNCIHNLYQFVKKRKNISVAPKYINNYKISKIYKKPNSYLLKFYHWLINSSDGYSPGKISLSGFNYSHENKSKGFEVHEWLSGGAVMHRRKNLILKNYYPYNFKRSFCEDILHSLLLRNNGIILYKCYDAKASAQISGNIVLKSNKLKTLKDFYSEYLIRKYIVKNFKLSTTRLKIYYFIFFLRILVRLFR